jgi:hypothetical protein
VASATGPIGADDVQIQFESHHEQQQRNAQFGQQIDLVICGDPAEYRWSHQDAYRDEGDDQRLAQPHTDSADDGRHQQQHCYFGKDVAKDRGHDSVTHTFLIHPCVILRLCVTGRETQR